MATSTPVSHKSKTGRRENIHALVLLLIFLSLNGLFLFIPEAVTVTMMFLYGIMVFCLSRVMEAISFPRKWAYRAAFIIVLFLAIAHWGSFALRGQDFSAFWLFLAAAWAFAGGLAATALGPGLWEDNYPPGAEITAQVVELHQNFFGALPRGSLSKRIFDMLLALAGIVLSSPVWILITFFIWVEDPGPLLFVKNSVGKGGRNFRQFKFRSMVRDAEKNTGPVLASEGDARVLKIGHVLRKTALDELPQLLNILKGEMSFVGPRPQRTVLVREYLRAMPEYAERHRVAPGISGLAQVVGSYYISPRQKLRLDRLYVHHASLGFDLKLLVIAFLLVFYLRWKKDWNGRIPRKWMRFGT